ncbi:unnamed protein product [Sphagnum balticum]
MVKDGPIMHNRIQYVSCCLLCLKKRPGKFLDSLVTIYNGTTSNVHKHIASMHPSLHLARKCQSFEPKQLISISTSVSVSANNICPFIKSSNDIVIERVHAFDARLVVNHKALLSLATDVDLNKHHHSDIILLINNTTNASPATSRLITNADGTYNMHFANLACDHVNRKRKRMFNKEIVDSFEECEDLRLAVHRMIGYIKNKKAKSCKINYEKRNEQIDYNVIKVGVDNDTRISGYARMYQQALCFKWTLHQYFVHEKSSMRNAYELLDERW